MIVKRTERGWAGHFICANNCHFRRNTLLEFGDVRVVVSTVGNMFRDGTNKPEPIGAFARIYETMAFHASKSGPYWDADVSRQVSFDADWSIDIPLPDGVDNCADSMHEAVVAELSGKMGRGVEL